ncbi:HD domain-containing protein [Micromonospora oryzae]|uniref:HD domain-containing protein n=1 Tax=Micromonospora sp. DSM 102119 TaxID=3111768 RepID=UPI0031D00393
MSVVLDAESSACKSPLGVGRQVSYPSVFIPPVPDQPGLSESARLVWGKTNRDRGFWLPLHRHLADSADVAGLLWDMWLPESVRRRIAAPLPGGADDGRRLVRWLAGIHDIGKATPAFAWQVKHLRRAMQDHGFVFDRGQAEVCTVVLDRRLVALLTIV